MELKGRKHAGLRNFQPKTVSVLEALPCCISIQKDTNCVMLSKIYKIVSNLIKTNKDSI